jgi:predicted nuclease with TOPRIM domain
MQEDKIEKVMEQFDLSFLQNVSWMSEHKKNELQERILHLREIKQEKEQLKQERSKIQMNIERMTDAYEMEVKKILSLLASNIEAMEPMNVTDVKKEIQDGRIDDDSFALDIDRGDPIFIHDEN